MANKKNSRTVYSTESGRLCPDCAKAIDQCNCQSKARTVDPDSIAKVCLETKGRKGKGVTVIQGLPLQNNELKDLAKRLKKVCGTGGAVKGCDIEIQGDKRDAVLEALIKQGFKAKRSGG